MPNDLLLGRWLPQIEKDSNLTESTEVLYIEKHIKTFLYLVETEYVTSQREQNKNSHDNCSKLRTQVKNIVLIAEERQSLASSRIARVEELIERFHEND